MFLLMDSREVLSSSFLTVAMILKPFCESRSAVARPMPEEAPVRSIVFVILGTLFICCYLFCEVFDVLR